MGRLILIVLVFVLVLWLLKRALAAGKRPEAPKAGESSDLVSCARCGVNLPRAEARSAGGRHYCSEEHWQQGPRDG